MSSAEPVLICYAYEYRRPSEERVCQQIVRRYAERGIATENVFRKELFEAHEGSFNLAAWDALSQYIQENNLYDRKIIMQDITDVYVFDTDLDFDPDNIFINRKINDQAHTVRTLYKNIKRLDVRNVNLSRRIDVDCTSLSAKGLWQIFFDARYRTLHRLSTDAVWGYGRSPFRRERREISADGP
jgi:hypothetical protein